MFLWKMLTLHQITTNHLLFLCNQPTIVRNLILKLTFSSKLFVSMAVRFQNDWNLFEIMRIWHINFICMKRLVISANEIKWNCKYHSETIISVWLHWLSVILCVNELKSAVRIVSQSSNKRVAFANLLNTSMEVSK